MYLATSSCVDNCCHGKLGDPVVSPDPLIEHIFRKNQYYDIIQMCWHAVSTTLYSFIFLGHLSQELSNVAREKCINNIISLRIITLNILSGERRPRQELVRTVLVNNMQYLECIIDITP